MAELDRKEYIEVDRSTFGSWRKKKGKLKARKRKSKQGSKKTMNSDLNSNVHSI